MTQATNITTGQQVKLVAPVDAVEAAAVYAVVELRGDRVVIELVCDLPIRPQECVLLTDITAK